MRTIETVTTFEDFLLLEDRWNALLAQSGRDIPFLRFEWFYCWFLGTGTRNALIVVVKENGEPVAIAPLMFKDIRWRGLPARSIIFMGEEHYFRTGFIMKQGDPSLVESIFEYLSSHCRYDLLSLDLLEKNSPSAEALPAVLAQQGVRSIEMPSDHSPYIPISGDWDRYLKSRSHNFRHKLNRIGNLFNRTGDYAFVKYTDENLQQAMEEVCAVSKKTWKYKAGISVAGSRESLRFYRILADAASAKGWLNLWVLKLRGVPIAFSYNLRYKEHVYALQIEFDEAYGSMSPGIFIGAHAIKDCFDQGLKEYDRLGKDAPYKMNWTTVCREHQKHLIFNNTSYGTMLYFWKTSFIDKIKTFSQKKAAAEPSPANQGTRI